MTIIAVIAALLISHFLRQWEPLRQRDWFSPISTWLSQRYGGSDFWNQPLGVLLVLAPLTLATLMMTWLLGDKLAGLLNLLFGITILWLSLGPRQPEHALDSAETALMNQDEELLNQTHDELAVDLEGTKDLGTSERILMSSFDQAHDRIYAVLFWFLLLGPAGAILFRQSSILLRQASTDDDHAGFTQAVTKLYWILTWVPARMTAMAYGLAGNFDDSREALSEHEQACIDDGDNNCEMLICVGRGAIRMPLPLESEETTLNYLGKTRQLIQRTTFIWVTFVALLTVVGWAS